MRALSALCWLALAALPARAASLDLTADYRLRALSYDNLALVSSGQRTLSLLSERARIGFAVKKIQLESRAGLESVMEVRIVLQALGMAGSTSPVTSPLDRIASRYPNSQFSPFVENAYLHVANLMGTPWDLTAGRQPVRIGSGLTLSDDGLGFTGLALKGPVGGWKAQGYYFQPRSLSASASDKVHVAGLSLDIPLAGSLQLNEMVESDGSSFVENGTALRGAVRHFPGARYLLKTDQFAFEGEGVLQRGSARPAAPGAKDIPYKGTAGLITGTWKQDLGRFGIGLARLSAGESTGDNASTAANESFYPSFGHRFDGLERDGWGDFFGASLYDAIGPSTTTTNGLPPGLSGLRIVRLGVTPPKFLGMTLDLDYLLFQAGRAAAGSRSLGNELDLRLTYKVQDRLMLRLSGAFFTASHAIRPVGTGQAKGQKFGFEVSGSF